MKKIKLDHVASVYSGKDGACCCGCSGKHTYATRHHTWSSKNRGYAVKLEEINNRTVSMIVNKMNRNLLYVVQDDESFVSMVLPGERLYIAYLHHCGIGTQSPNSKSES